MFRSSQGFAAVPKTGYGFTSLAVEALHLTEAHALLTVIQTAHFESSGDTDVLEVLHGMLALMYLYTYARGSFDL